ncbi:MAG: hypothetical protein EPN79_11940 [Burkholderiaceae bacterium]|nr:MAG: hypothetical protein EPN79_11940 [Burkholderiaceae bacterium]TBR76865.1 MAG: hypothetical protein EPN64_06490 [Burkholderiaceae bacterium]
MNHKEIIVGRIYHDGKAGLRKVTSISGSPIAVRYRILAAKVERDFDWRSHQYQSLIGHVGECTLEAFARWANTGYDEAGAQAVLLSLQARKIKLSPGEDAFMRSAAAKVHVAGQGSKVSYSHTEGRAITGLEKKGLLLPRLKITNQVEFSPLGRAKLLQLASCEKGHSAAISEGAEHHSEQMEGDDENPPRPHLA